MTHFIRCAVRTLRRVHAMVVDDVACIRGERWRRVGGNDSLSESSLMMAGVPTRDGTLIGELIPTLLHVGFRTFSGLRMKTGLSSLMGRGALTCGRVGAVEGTSPRISVRSTWIAASLSGGASWTPSIAAVRRAVVSRILSVAVMVGTGMAWWQNQNVSVMRSPPVPAIKTRMQR